MLEVVGEVTIKGITYTYIKHEDKTIHLYFIHVPKILTPIQFITRYNCYLLESVNRKAKKKIYFGYTVNPERRLKQHNGLLVGGAKHTKKNRPWRMLFYISGFDSEHSALQYEYMVNKLLGKKKTKSVKPAIEIINSVLDRPNWCRNSVNSKQCLFTFNWLSESVLSESVLSESVLSEGVLSENCGIRNCDIKYNRLIRPNIKHVNL